VAGYHYGTWQRDRGVRPPGQPQPEVVRPADQPAQPAGDPVPGHGLRHVILVTGIYPAPWVGAIRETTGAGVAVWGRAGLGRTAVAPPDFPDADTAGPAAQNRRLPAPAPWDQTPGDWPARWKRPEASMCWWSLAETP
jgi:hypothetical protein